MYRYSYFTQVTSVCQVKQFFSVIHIWSFNMFKPIGTGLDVACCIFSAYSLKEIHIDKSIITLVIGKINSVLQCYKFIKLSEVCHVCINTLLIFRIPI